MKKIYFYEKRYKSKSEKIRAFSFFIDSLIKKLFHFLSLKFKYFYSLRYLEKPDEIWLKKNQYFLETLKFDKNDWHEGADLNYSEEEKCIGDLFVSKIIFFEIVNIDELRRKKSKIISKYYKYSDYFNNLDGYSRLNERVNNILDNYSGSGSGNLLYLDFSKKKDLNIDLLKSISVKYNKIGESLIILSYEVIVSNRFKTIQRKIFKIQDSLILEVSRFKFKLGKKGVSHSMGAKSLGTLSIFSFENLISDLSIQIANKFKFIDGYFVKEKKYPTMVIFENKGQNYDLYNFFKGNNFLFETDVVIFKNKFDYKSINIFYYFNNKLSSLDNNDLNQSKKFETDSLISSIGILNCINLFLDFNVKDISKRRSELNLFFIRQKFLISQLFPVYFYYIKLKFYSSQISLFYERFFNDLLRMKAFKYFSSNNINLIKPDLNNFINKDKNLEEVFALDFEYKIKYFKKNIELFKLVLNDFENLNNYKTNYFLQVIVILLTILTLYLSLFKNSI